MSPSIRVAIADDHAAIREALGRFVEREPDMCLVGEAAGGDGVLALVLDQHPDVLVLDVRMPGPPCPALVGRVKRESPATAVVIYTAFDEQRTARALVLAGATGFVTKDEPMETIVAAVRAVATGGTWLRESLRSPLPAYETPTLAPRERAVLEALVQGFTERQIAQRLGVSDRSVRHTLRSLYDKFGVGSRVRLAVVATALGLVDPRLDSPLG